MTTLRYWLVRLRVVLWYWRKLPGFWEQQLPGLAALRTAWALSGAEVERRDGKVYEFGKKV